MKKLLSLLSLLALAAIPALAQKTGKDNYNYQRGVEAYEADKPDEAVKYLAAALEEDEKNGYALAYLGSVHRNVGNYGLALSAYRLALKYVPDRDKDFLATLHAERAKAYWQTDDTLRALSEVEQAMRLAPKNSDYPQGRGNFLYYIKCHAEAEADYKAALALDTASASIRALLAVNACAREHWQDAANWAREALRRDSDCTQMYLTRTEAYFHLGKTREAVAELARAWRFCGFHDGVYKWTDSLAKTDYSATTQALMAMQRERNDDPDYYFALGYAARATRRYDTALKMLQKYADAAGRGECRYFTGCSFRDMYRLGEAVREMRSAYEADSSNVDFMLECGRCLANEGCLEESLPYLNKAVEEQPLNPYPYYRRALVYRQLGNYEAALDDAFHCAALEDEASPAQMCVARCLLSLGRTQEARPYLEEAARLDSVPYGSTERMFALFCLGRTDEAGRWTERMLQEEERCFENGQMAQPDERAYLCAARFYALAGDRTQSLKHLRTAFEHNFRDFYLLRHCEELKSLQGDSAFEALIKEYSEKPTTWK